MFGSLFETGEEGSKNSKSGTTGRASKQNKLNWPPQPRGVTGICGLQNQGATCYLNSLLQTLFFIPEFRGKFDIWPQNSRQLGIEGEKSLSRKYSILPFLIKELIKQVNKFSNGHSTGFPQTLGWKSCRLPSVQKIYLKLKGSYFSTEVYIRTPFTKDSLERSGNILDFSQKYFNFFI